MRLRYNRAIMPPICPDLIPFTAHGASLANLLTLRSWEEIRRPVIEPGRCQVCGYPKALECHEIWAYASPPDEPKFDACLGIMKLIGLAVVCKSCHEFFHMGFARVKGREGVASTRMMGINRWSAAEFDEWDRASSDRCASRGNRYWGLDVSLLKDFYLEIDEGKGWMQADSGMLYRPPHYKPETPNPDRPETHTGIIGCDYDLGGVVYFGHDVEVAYEGLNPLEGDFEFVRSMGSGIAAPPVSLQPELPVILRNFDAPPPPPERPRRSWWWHLKNLYVQQEF